MPPQRRFTTHRRAVTVVGLMCTVMVMGAVIMGCRAGDDEAQIRRLIARGASAAEAHDIAAMLKLASTEVRAMPMSLDRQGIKAVLWRTFNYYGPLAVLYPRPVVTINGATARATVPFLIVKKEHPFTELERLRDDPSAWLDAVDDAADLYRLQLVLVGQNGEWLVNEATLERFTGVGFE